MFPIWIAALMLSQSTFSSTDLTLVDHGRTIAVLHRSDIALMEPGPPILDEQKIQRLSLWINKKVERPPVNAAIAPSGSITAGKSGQRLYQAVFKNRLIQAFYSKKSTRVNIPLLTTQPKVDSELLGQIRTEQISSYSTRFNPANESRANNIFLATQALNSTVVFPGETFSFNQTVGQRTTGKGYRVAKIIVRGEYSEGIGGGICQVSSTLFNAADKAGLQIVQRFSHSKHVSYVPPGRDATVSWYGPDFQFRNNYNQPILIRGKSGNGFLTLALYSSDVIKLAPKRVPSPPANPPKETRDKSERAE